MVLAQLRFLGMTDVVSLMHAAYPTRIPYTTLHSKYAKRMPPIALALALARTLPPIGLHASPGTRRACR